MFAYLPDLSISTDETLAALHFFILFIMALIAGFLLAYALLIRRDSRQLGHYGRRKVRVTSERFECVSSEDAP